MSHGLPEAVDAYFAAKKENDIEVMVSLFAKDAVVTDEGREMRGIAAIRAWITDTNRKYKYSVDVTDVSGDDNRPLVSGRLTGDFPGSPVDVQYAFALKDKEITRLEIS